MIYLEPREVYDKFIIGIAEGINVEEPCLIYSKNKIIDYLMLTMGQELILDHNQSNAEDVIHVHQINIDMANEYFEYNISGAYMGAATPIFMSNYSKDSND